MIRAYLRRWLGVEDLADLILAGIKASRKSEKAIVSAVNDLGRKVDGRERLQFGDNASGDVERGPDAPIEFWAEQTQTGKWREVTFTERAGHMDGCRKFREVVE